jgi:hypothetical protein
MMANGYAQMLQQLWVANCCAYIYKRFGQITAKILSIGLSEPAPMTAPVLFWMEGNSSRTCKPFSSSPSYIFGGPNILVSSVSRSNVHNSISHRPF